MRRTIFSAVALAALVGCSPDPALLPGDWKAAAFFEDHKRVDTPLDSVALVLSPQGGYSFSSIGHYREAGPYRLAGAYLYLTDTTDNPSREHTVKILYLSSDTLKLLMRSGEKRQVLFLAKEK